MFLGLRRAGATQFAFLIGLPAIGGAGLLALKDLFESYTQPGLEISLQSEFVNLGLGFIVSFVVYTSTITLM